MSEAQIALQTAYSFLRETVTGLEDQKHSDPKALLNNTALAAKQIQIAEKLDPNATIIIKRLGDNTDVELDITYLKAMALLHEGQIYAEMNQANKAIAALQKAAAHKPDLSYAWYWLGLAHGMQLNRTDAIAALDKAINLEPTNIEYRKAMERAKSISGSQIVLDRTATAVQKTGTGLIWLWAIFFLGFIAMVIYNGSVLFSSDAALTTDDKIKAAAAIIVSFILAAVIFPVLNFIIGIIKG